MTQCETTGAFNVVLGWSIAVGTFPLAYLPQILKQRQQRSHIGVSLMNFLFMGLVTWMTLVNYLSVLFDQTFNCCSGQDANVGKCIANMAPVVQLVITWVGTACCIVLYFIYFDRQGLERRGSNADAALKADLIRVAVALAVHLVVFVVPAVLAIAAGSINAESVQRYGAVGNVAVNIMTSCHWTFQIYETYVTWGFGSLSVLSVIAIAGGNMMSAVTFLLNGSVGVSIGYLIAGIMSFVILGIGSYAEGCRCCHRATPDKASPDQHVEPLVGQVSLEADRAC